jgi:ligand-binding sensor domain-containing protein
LDKHVEEAKLAANALCRGGDRSLICHIELEGAGIWPNLPGRGFATLKVARAKQHNEAMLHQILRDLKADSLIGSGNQDDRFFLHRYLSSDHWSHLAR